MIPPLFGKQEVGIWRVKKRFPWYGVPIWSLWPNIRSLPSIVAEKNVTKNVHICSMCIKTNKVGKQEVGIWWVQKRHQQLLRKVRRKISWTDRGKTVYPPPPSGSGGYNKIQKVKLTFCVSYMIRCFSFHLMTLCVGICELRWTTRFTIPKAFVVQFIPIKRILW
jgi:hypothetical protein